MNQQIKRKWVKALLSGKYEQGSGYLYVDGEYCCLGVLGSVCGIPDEKLYERSFLSSKAERAFAPPHSVQNRLAELNDEGVPFDMIAGLIDEAL